MTLLEQFVAEAGRLEATTTLVAGAAALGAGLAQWLRAAGARRVMQARHPLLAAADLPRHLAGSGVELVTWGDLGRQATIDFLAGCDAGIAVGSVAIAASGSVGVMAGPDQGRTLALLPPHALLVVPPGVLVPDLAAAFRLILPDRQPPSMLNFITGPSRTRDIENDPALGIHGPRVHLFLCAGA